MFHPLYAFLSLLTNCIALWRWVLEFVRQLLLFGIAKPKTELPLWLINLQLQAMSPHTNRTRHPSPRLERKKGKGKHKIQVSWKPISGHKSLYPGGSYACPKNLTSHQQHKMALLDVKIYVHCTALYYQAFDFSLILQAKIK